MEVMAVCSWWDSLYKGVGGAWYTLVHASYQFQCVSLNPKKNFSHLSLVSRSLSIYSSSFLQKWSRKKSDVTPSWRPFVWSHLYRVLSWQRSYTCVKKNLVSVCSVCCKTFVCSSGVTFPAPTWGSCLKMRVFRLRPYLAESTVSRPINSS